MKKIILAFILILAMTLAACATPSPITVNTEAPTAPVTSQAAPSSPPLNAESLTAQTTPAAEHLPAVPYVVTNRNAEFPYDYHAKLIAPAAPLILDERCEYNGELLWMNYWSFPQFMNMSIRTDDSVTDSINRFFKADFEKQCEAAALEEQQMIEHYESFYTKNGENSAEQPSSIYNMVQYKTAAAGGFTSGNEMYNIMNVFYDYDNYVGLGTAAAHLIGRHMCTVFSLKTGAQITLADLFTVDEEVYRERVCDEMYLAFQNANHWFTSEGGEGKKQYLYDMFGYFVSDSYFALTDTGLVILFGLDTAAEATSPDELWVSVPYACLEDIMIPIGEIVNITQ